MSQSEASSDIETEDLEFELEWQEEEFTKLKLQKKRYSTVTQLGNFISPTHQENGKQQMNLLQWELHIIWLHFGIMFL